MKNILILCLYFFCFENTIYAQNYSWADDRHKTEVGRHLVIYEAVSELDTYFKGFVTDFAWKLSNDRETTEYCLSNNFSKLVYMYNVYATIKIRVDNCYYYISTNEKITCDAGDFACYVTVKKPTMKYMFLTEQMKTNYYPGWFSTHSAPDFDITVQERELLRCNTPCSLVNKYRYTYSVTDANDIPIRGKDRTDKYLVISPKAFTKGFLDLDPEGSVLWDNDYKNSGVEDKYNQYYRYAKDLKEAIQFLIFHEYAHITHESNEEVASELAKNLIVQLRRAKRNESFSTLLVDKYIGKSLPNSGNSYHAYNKKGTPPSIRNLPPGTLYYE